MLGPRTRKVSFSFYWYLCSPWTKSALCTFPLVPCQLHSQGLVCEIESEHTYLQELKGTAGP